MQKLESKLKSAVEALQQEQISSEKTHRRDALEIHSLEEQIKVFFLHPIWLCIIRSTSFWLHLATKQCIDKPDGISTMHSIFHSAMRHC